MKPLLDPRAVKDSPRYWSVALDEHGEHHFRFPSYARAYQVLHFSAALADVPALMRTFELAGLTIGLCWWHRAYDLDGAIPAHTASIEALSAYSDAVIDQLQEAGYSQSEIEDLYGACISRILVWAQDVEETRTPADRKAATATEGDEPDAPEGDGPDLGPFDARGVGSTSSP